MALPFGAKAMLKTKECSPPTTCHMSGADVRFQVSGVTCHMSGVTYFFIFIFIYFLDKVVKLVGGGSVINGAYPV